MLREHTFQPSPARPTESNAPLRLFLGVVSLVVFLLVAAAPASAADRAFTQRFSTVTNGDVAIVGNASMSCPNPPSADCTSARAGGAFDNNDFSMAYIDVDSDASTSSSSSADLTLPAGSSVLFAGLYWGGESTAADSVRGAVKLRTPASGGYVDLTATALNGATADPSQYHAFRDVTSLVHAGGSGTYTTANVNGTSSSSNKYAGWSLVVAYRDAGGPRNHLKVFDGLQRVSNTNRSETVALSGFTTPSTGPVAASVGVVAYDGDLANIGGSVALNGTALSDALNPANNVMNSTITRRGTRFSAKSPDYVNQLGLDADVLAADGALTPGSTSANLDLTLAWPSGDYFLPGVVSLANTPASGITAPDTTITSGPSGATNNNTPTFGFSSPVAGATFQCRVDFGDWTSCSSPYTTAALADGPHSFEVRAVDAIGNVDDTPASRSITVDTAAPDTTILTGPSGATNNNTPTYTFSASESGSSFQCRVDTGAWASCSSPHTTAALSDGPHSFEVRAIDAAGNVDATPASRSITVDTAAPDTTILTGPSGATNNNTPTYTFSASESGSSFQCRVDTGAWASCSSPRTTAVLADGPHSFEVRAIDAAGNVDATPASRSITVDTAAPDTTILTGPSGATNNNTPTYTFSASESGSSFQCRVDTGAWASCSSPHTTAVLSDGPHSFEVRAIDAAGNVDATPASRSITVDTAAPDTTILTGPSGATNNNTPTYTFSASESGSSFQCRVDTGAWASCSSPHTTAALSDGPHSFEVRAIDAAGNVDATPASRSITVDTAAPDTTILTGPSGATNNNTPTYTFSASESGSSFQCRVDTGAWASCSSPHTTAALSDGPHSFEVRAIDAAGNVDATPASRSITVDTAAPDTTILTGPSGATNNNTPTYTFSASESGSSFQCRVDTGAWASCSSPHTTAALSDGPHSFEVRAIDAAGNVDATSASRSITVDTAAPDTTILTGPSGATNNNTPTYTFSASESGSSFQCRVDTGAWASCSSPHTTAALSDGPHSFEVRAIDAAGNVDATPASRSITVDTAAPAAPTLGDTDPDSPANDNDPEVKGSAEAGSTVRLYTNASCTSAVAASGTAAAFATPGLTVTVANDTTTSFWATATDAVGNVSACSTSPIIYVEDSTAPNTTIDSGPSGPTANNDPSFGFSSSEPGSSFECSLDGGAFTACSDPKAYTDLPDGAHSFEVRAIDAAGNVDATPASRNFTIDTAAPNTTIDSGPTGASSDDTPTYTFSSSEPGSTFECRVDTGAWASCSSPHTTAALSDGPHSFEVRAIDAAGNVDPSPASVSITIDTAAPQTTIDSGPSGPTANNDPSFGFSSSEPGSSFECSLDGGAFTACSDPKAYTDLPDGAHSFEVRAIDAAGNVDATPASRNFTIDTAAPNTTIDSGPTGASSDDTPTYTFSSSEPGSTFECRVDTGAWASCSSPHTTAALSDGPHSFEVRAIDAAGNVDPSPASVSITIDTAAPQTTIDSGPSGPTANNDPSFGFSSSEPGSSFECSLDGGAFTACSDPKAYTDLPDGAHSFEVRAIDAAGNVDATPASRNFTIDTAAPNTTIDSGPTGASSDDTPTYTFSSSEPGSTFECRVDTGAWASCSSPHTTAALSDGPHSFEVRAIDAAGNVDPSPASVSITIDTAAPQTTIDSGPSGPTANNDPSFGFSSSEPGSSFECSLDGGAFTACSDPKAYTDLPDGAHSFEVRAIDAAGNVDATPASRNFTIDTAAPNTTIDSGPTGASSDDTPTYTFSSSEPGSTFECRVDTGAWASCSSPHTTAALSDGPHSFEVRAIDAAGNVDPSPASVSITIDTAAPQTTIDSGPSGPTANNDPSFGFSSSEPGSSFECSLDGGAFTACSDPKAYTDLPDGAHSFEVRAIDAAGNVDATPASRNFTIDTAAPNTTIDSGPTGASSDDTPTYTFSSSEPGSTFECRVDTGAWASCSSPHTTAALSDGPHSFEVRAIDAAGNVDPSPASVSITIDTAAPQTTIDSGPSGPTANNDPSFGFSSSEPGSSFECSLDGGAFTACSDPKAYTDLPDGAHSFEVRAIDAAGNVDATPASRNFTIDTAAPNTTIDSGPTGASSDDTPTYTFSSSEPGSTFECRVDTGAWASCSSPHTTAALSDGPHSFEVRAIDAAGNVDPSPASVSITIDTAAPQTTIDSGPSGTTSDNTPTYTFSSSEPGSTFECRVDGGAWASCSSPHTTAALSDGPHSFEVRAIDPAGNVDQTPASRSITVATGDTTPPQTTIDSGPSGTTSDNTPTYTFSSSEPGSSFQCRVDGGAWASCSSPHTTAALADGPHTFEVRAIDAAGNPDPSPASRSFTIDTTPPVETEIPGSLVSPNSCQQLGPGGTRRLKRRVPGVGTVRVALATQGQIMGSSPMVATTRAPKGRLRSVRYAIDGRRLNGTKRAQSFSQAIRPAQLSASSRHTLTVNLKPRRGRARRFGLRFSTLRCNDVFIAQQRRKGSGSKLSLRVDSTRSMNQITFRIPRRMLPKVNKNRTVGRLYVQAAGGAAQSFRLGLGAGVSGGTLTGAPAPISVTISGGAVAVSGLPAGTRIVKVTLLRNRKATRKAFSRKSPKVSALVISDGEHWLKTRIRGRKAKKR